MCSSYNNDERLQLVLVLVALHSAHHSNAVDTKKLHGVSRMYLTSIETNEVLTESYMHAVWLSQIPHGSKQSTSYKKQYLTESYTLVRCLAVSA